MKLTYRPKSIFVIALSLMLAAVVAALSIGDGGIKPTEAAKTIPCTSPNALGCEISSEKSMLTPDASSTVAIARPDLIVKTLEAKGVARLALTDWGKAVVIPVEIVVRNQGSASAEEFETVILAVKDKDAKHGRLVGFDVHFTLYQNGSTSSKLNPGSEKRIVGEINYYLFDNSLPPFNPKRPLTNRFLKFRAFVDRCPSEFPPPGCYVQESDETNNWSDLMQTDVAHLAPRAG